MGGPKFRFANIREKTSGELKVAISIKDRKRLTKSIPSKGAGASSKAKSQKSDKSQRKRGRRFREMETCLAVQKEIDRA